MNPPSNVQKNQPTITSIHIREIEKPKIKIKIQTTPKTKPKTLQKFNSNKLFMEKKFSSINITPKNNNQTITFNLEDYKHSKVSSTVINSVKNKNKKQINYTSINTNATKNKKQKPIMNNNTQKQQRGSYSHSKTINSKFMSFNGTINSKNKTNIFTSPIKNSKFEEHKEIMSVKNSIKKRNKKPINVNIDVDNLTDNNEKRQKSHPTTHTVKKTHSSFIKPNEKNNIQVIKGKNQNNKYSLTINTGSKTNHNDNQKRRTLTTTSNNSSKLLHNNNNSINIVGISQSITSSNKTLHKYNTNITHLKNNKFGIFQHNGILNYTRTMNHNSSTITTISTTHKDNSKNLFLNNSYDNFSFSGAKHSKLSISTSLQANSFKQKMKIKVNRKPNQMQTLPSKITSISLNKNNSRMNSINTNSTLSNIEVIYKYHKYLSEYEINELKNFKYPIYYIGLIEDRKKDNLFSYVNINKSFCATYDNIYENKRTITKCKSESNIEHFRSSHLNNNYDDPEGDYILNPGEHLNYRYEIICLLGKGSYGEAVKCLDHKTKEYVCIKIIKSNMKFHNQAMIEIKLLDYIAKNDLDGETNIVKFYSHFKFRNHICLVFELLDINLFEYLKANDFNGIDIKRIRSYTTEILFALLFLKRHKIIHCDLKPENILLLKHSKTSVKVIDFGSSCFDKEKLYSYIQSRFYRAPEVLLEQGYSIQIDIWSLGCILCELYTGVPIFPGEDERDQLNYIMEYLDVPPLDYINMSLKKDAFFDKKGYPYQKPNSNGKIRMPHTKTFQHFLKGSGETFIDFIKKCLKWYPEHRMKPEEALMHKFIVGDMNYEALYQHKQKIKRIKCGITRQIRTAKARTNLNSNRKGNFSNSGIRRNSDSKGKSCKYSTLHDEPNCLSHPTSTKNIKIQSHSLNKDRGISKKKVKTKENTISLLTLND